ncbi:MAG: NAD-dependent dihydropyrimidine dehydrogenase subunit PreA [Planctomycetota bacterium]|nr:MAG: NAD-dependent dihydropyrimidine dehydrogenase subunit PreA [Planctomycetota bacterium]
MADLSVTVDGLEFDNPFVIGSGPPGSNYNTMARAYDQGWGGVVCKTVALECEKVHNVAPRYARLRVDNDDTSKKNIFGFENIELISDRPFSDWLDDFKRVKDDYPDKVLIASIMEEPRKEAWQEITERCQEAGVDAFELNLSCPHGLPERKMGMAMGQHPDLVREVCGWVMEVAKVPVWAKMTPNVTDITEPARAAFEAGCQGVSAINTILSVMGVDLKTLRPLPTVEGYTTPGGYSCKAVRPIALRQCMQLARAFPDKTLSGIGGIETGKDAAQFLLLGAHTVQVCTGVMLYGYKMVKDMIAELSAFMDEHGFSTIEEFRGKSLEYFTTHADLHRRQVEAKVKKALERDTDWKGDEFVEQSEKLVTDTVN